MTNTLIANNTFVNSAVGHQLRDRQQQGAREHRHQEQPVPAGGLVADRHRDRLRADLLQQPVVEDDHLERRELDRRRRRPAAREGGLGSASPTTSGCCPPPPRSARRSRCPRSPPTSSGARAGPARTSARTSSDEARDARVRPGVSKSAHPLAGRRAPPGQAARHGAGRRRSPSPNEGTQGDRVAHQVNRRRDGDRPGRSERSEPRHERGAGGEQHHERGSDRPTLCEEDARRRERVAEDRRREGERGGGAEHDEHAPAGGELGPVEGREHRLPEEGRGERRRLRRAPRIPAPRAARARGSRTRSPDWTSRARRAIAAAPTALTTVNPTPVSWAAAAKIPRAASPPWRRMK